MEAYRTWTDVTTVSADRMPPVERAVEDRRVL